MTELYVIHRLEQLDAAREEFALAWAIVIRLEPHLNTLGHQQRAWVTFLQQKNLLNPRTQKPPSPPCS